ncbi:hypothetical protein N0V86_003180 [Didymella sp. IMI 355093]|nr:hypothetical protein N0V86_003180 [Didymella sp. IMI 355093]
MQPPDEIQSLSEGQFDQKLAELSASIQQSVQVAQQGMPYTVPEWDAQTTQRMQSFPRVRDQYLALITSGRCRTMEAFLAKMNGASSGTSTRKQESVTSSQTSNNEAGGRSAKTAAVGSRMKSTPAGVTSRARSAQPPKPAEAKQSAVKTSPAKPAAPLRRPVKDAFKILHRPQTSKDATKSVEPEVSGTSTTRRNEAQPSQVGLAASRKSHFLVAPRPGGSAKAEEEVSKISAPVRGTSKPPPSKGLPANLLTKENLEFYNEQLVKDDESLKDDVGSKFPDLDESYDSESDDLEEFDEEIHRGDVQNQSQYRGQNHGRNQGQLYPLQGDYNGPPQVRWNGPPPQGGYGGWPQGGYNGPPQGGYNGPPHEGWNGPPQGGYNVPPQGGYGGWAPGQPHYGGAGNRRLGR